MTDISIGASIRRELAGRYADLSKISFHVKMGEVTLRGSLCFVGAEKTNEETAVELKFIEAAIKRINGVKSLKFELDNWVKSEGGLWESADAGKTAHGRKGSAFTGEGLYCEDCDLVIRFCPCCGKPLTACAKGAFSRARRALPPIKPIIKKKKPFMPQPTASQPKTAAPSVNKLGGLSEQKKQALPTAAEPKPAAVPIMPDMPAPAPAKTAKPAAPTKPTMPAMPATPQAHAAPVKPTMPATPQTHAMPAMPTMPETPQAPAAPAKPTMPATPQTPAAPQMPAMPETPQAHAAPAKPTMPTTPQTPAMPAMPETPKTPAAPQMPTMPQMPAVGEQKAPIPPFSLFTGPEAKKTGSEGLTEDITPTQKQTAKRPGEAPSKPALPSLEGLGKMPMFGQEPTGAEGQNKTNGALGAGLPDLNFDLGLDLGNKGPDGENLTENIFGPAEGLQKPLGPTAGANLPPNAGFAKSPGHEAAPSIFSDAAAVPLPDFMKGEEENADLNNILGDFNEEAALKQPQQQPQPTAKEPPEAKAPFAPLDLSFLENEPERQTQQNSKQGEESGFELGLEQELLKPKNEADAFEAEPASNELGAFQIDEDLLPPLKPKAKAKAAGTPKAAASIKAKKPVAAAPSEDGVFDLGDDVPPPIKKKSPKASANGNVNDPFASLFSDIADSIPDDKAGAQSSDPFASLNLDMDVLEVLPSDTSSAGAPSGAPPAPIADTDAFNIGDIIDLDSPVPDTRPKTAKKPAAKQPTKDSFDLGDLDLSDFKL